MPDEQQQQDEIAVDLTSDDKAGGLQAYEPKTMGVRKELTARWVAQAIVLTFAISIILLIVLGFTTVLWLRWAPDKAAQIFANALIPFVERVATFASTVFGPLLAFILGYYFGEKQSKT